MQKSKKLENKGLRTRRYSQWNKPQNKCQNKENSLLPVLSIRQLKAVRNCSNNLTQVRVSAVSKARNELRNFSLLNKDNRPRKTCAERMQTPYDTNSDSFQKFQNQQTTELKQYSAEKKRAKTFLPPINKRLASHPNSPLKSVVSKQTSETTNKKKKQRLKTHCKVILERNNMFPFLSNVSNKTTKFEKSSLNTQNQGDSQFFDFEESQIKISQEPQMFISKESLKDLPCF